MSTLTARPPYSQDELDKLYPESVELQQVQVLLRHGERTPVSSRFRNAGLGPYWPYCRAARQLQSAVLASTDHTQWIPSQYRRRLETFGNDDSPMMASDKHGGVDAICLPGELTDKGRETTLALGQRLRRLYIDQLAFMPQAISDANSIYLRSTPVPRALESLQQAFHGLYPPNARTANFSLPTIVIRSFADETLFPNEGSCKRLGQLSREFGQRAADRWNASDDMRYLNRALSKWMPTDSPAVAVDSHPRLSGIMDTINATKAHGPDTKLPKEFYDEKVLSIIDKIAVEEWFAGYTESREYRMLGVGALLGDIVGRMMSSVASSGRNTSAGIEGGQGQSQHEQGGDKDLKFALSGCHDTTLAGILCSLGAFDEQRWPPYTSHIALELFSSRNTVKTTTANQTTAQSDASRSRIRPSWWQALFGFSAASPSKPDKTARTPIEGLSDSDKQAMSDYYVRIRYNDEVMQVPACRLPGNHLDGHESFCTLAAFKSVVDKFTPQNWKTACNENLGQSAFSQQPEPAGH